MDISLVFGAGLRSGHGDCRTYLMIFPVPEKRINEEMGEVIAEEKRRGRVATWLAL